MRASKKDSKECKKLEKEIKKLSAEIVTQGLAGELAREHKRKKSENNGV